MSLAVRSTLYELVIEQKCPFIRPEDSTVSVSDAQDLEARRINKRLMSGTWHLRG